MSTWTFETRDKLLQAVREAEHMAEKCNCEDYDWHAGKLAGLRMALNLLGYQPPEKPS